MTRCNDTLASLLTGTEALSSVGLGFGVHVDHTADVPEAAAAKASQQAAKKELNNEKEMSKKQLNDEISREFKSSLYRILKNDWVRTVLLLLSFCILFFLCFSFSQSQMNNTQGVQLIDMSIVDIDVTDKNVRNALANG